jgi:uncharacterized membrane protein YeiH
VNWDFLPDLANKTPLWLALVTVGVNAAVGALRASIDDEHHWDIVGMATFAVLMGLGGGFIRDFLIGNQPVESLRTPWYLVTVLGVIGAVLVLGERISRITFLVNLLNALALGLFSIVGTAYGLRAGLPVISSIFIGVVSAVGGGVLVSLMKDEVPTILLASTPNALVALLSAIVYAITDVWDARAASVFGIVAAVAAHYTAHGLGIETQRIDRPSTLLFTRTRRRDRR